MIVIFAAALLRFADALRPIDHASWRECDEGSISRNFAVEGMNPLTPQIDWRGSGPGYAEMELPLYPFLTAVTYKIFGIHDEIGRMWSLLFSLGALIFFFKLAREYLNETAAVIALAFIAFNPLMTETATSIQPESLMIFAYITAVYFFIKWLRTDRAADFWVSTAMTALAILAKAPATHIGLFFGILLLQKYGLKVIKQRRVWLFGILTVLPAGLWYLHAKRLWTTYGNSLGVSNEYHWIGWDFFNDPNFVGGILRSEFLYVWVVFGMIAGAFALWRGPREEPAKHALLWLASIFAFYLIAARTTSQDWASYYHVFSIPPVALIFGFGAKKLWDYAGEFTDKFSRRSTLINLGRVFVMFVIVASIFATFLTEAKQVRASYLNHRVAEPAFVLAKSIKPKLTNDGLIIASGGHCVDKNGYALAYNASYMFYWLDRKGWNVCVEDQSSDNIHVFVTQGAKYFVAERSLLNEKPGFEDDLRRDYSLLDESDGFLLFDLTQRR